MPKGDQREIKRDAKGRQKETKGDQRDAKGRTKGNQRRAKGDQRETKGMPKWITKVDCPKWIITCRQAL